MSITRTCFWFDRDGEAAARFYTSLVPGSELGEVVPAPAGTPNVEPGAALTIDFTLGGQRYQILNGGPGFQHSPAASIVLECETQAEADDYWNALVEGGTEGQCGWLTDRYGLWWQIVPLPAIELLKDPATAQAATAAMLTMSRIDSAEMARAAGR